MQSKLKDGYDLIFCSVAKKEKKGKWDFDLTFFSIVVESRNENDALQETMFFFSLWLLNQTVKKEKFR